MPWMGWGNEMIVWIVLIALAVVWWGGVVFGGIIYQGFWKNRGGRPFVRSRDRI